MTGWSCDYLYNPFYSGYENPWTVDNAAYITNLKGRAAGHLKVDNGKSYSDNKCKFVVLYDEEDDRRMLSQTKSSNGSRALKKKYYKKKYKYGPSKIGCGRLIPEGEYH